MFNCIFCKVNGKSYKLRIKACDRFILISFSVAFFFDNSQFFFVGIKKIDFVVFMVCTKAMPYFLLSSYCQLKLLHFFSPFFHAIHRQIKLKVSKSNHLLIFVYIIRFFLLLLLLLFFLQLCFIQKYNNNFFHFLSLCVLYHSPLKTPPLITVIQKFSNLVS